MRRVDIDDGIKSGVTSAESAELREARRRILLLKERGLRTGWVYLHSIVDGSSRLASTEALPDEKGITAVGFINRAKAFFAAHGVVRFTRVVTDNGSLTLGG